MNPYEGWRVTSLYGERVHPKKNVKGFHTGIDLANYDKCPIPAFYEGEVVYAGNGRTGTGFGNMGNVVALYVIHPTGRADLHVYLHLYTVGVKVGQIIKKGQVIGTQGNTGAYSMGSHLHFEVRKRASKGIPFGWTKQDDPDMCYEPTQYLIDLYKEMEKEDEYVVSPEDANKIIRFLSASWFLVQGNKESEKEVNRLANELRKVSGQKLQ